MRVIDLTHVIAPGMPVYPGTEGPMFVPANSYERDGFRETALTLYTHTGTHMDPPAHLFPGGTTLDRFPASQFVGTACVIDCSGLGEGSRITLEHIERRRALADQADFLLFHTGWDRHWGTERYFGDYPCIDEGVADFVLANGKKGLGLDTIGLDPLMDANLTLHKKLFRTGELVVIENLKDLCLLGSGLFTLCALPLHYQNADGAPTRVVGILEE